LRAKRAGFDIVYVYAGHGYLPFQFLSRLSNRRTDEYGGSLENRARLLKELIEDTKEAVGDSCGIAVRLAVDELLGPDGVTCDGDGRAAVELLAEMPDIWDVNVGDFRNDAPTSRFAPEAAQEQYVAFVKQVTTKPVVGVGRFTSPDTMVSQIRRGVLDMIGAARPSSADPFLPRKIQEGRTDDIRECIGCNICISFNGNGVPMRCTQNPTVGEEWRRGWHPERIATKSSEAKILIVGGGPAGMECARALGAQCSGRPAVRIACGDGQLAAKDCRVEGVAMGPVGGHREAMAQRGFDRSVPRRWGGVPFDGVLYRHRTAS
jgi:dimethylamine/trimethylamine dehydrogenase